MNGPLEILIEFVEENYEKRTPTDQQRIVQDHEFYANESRTDPDVMKRDSYLQHTTECVPCMRSAVVQRRKRGIVKDFDVECYINELELS